MAVEPALLAARRSHERGVAAFAAGRPDESVTYLQQALDRLDLAPAGVEAAGLRVRALTSLAIAEFERSGLALALELLDRAAALVEEHRDPVLVALGHSQRAALLGRSGDLGAALDQLDAAAAYLDQLPPRDRWVVLLNRGMLRSLRADLPAAAEDFGLAERIASDHGLPREAAMALHNRGWVAYLAGDLPGALALMERADDMGADLSQAVTRQDRGRVLMEAGLVAEAVEVLTAGVADAVAHREHQVLAETQLELARARGLLGDVGGGLELARAARDRFRRRGAPLWAARSEAVGVELALARGTRLGAVARTAERLVETAVVACDLALQRHARLLAAQARSELGEVAAATAHLRAAEATGRTGAGAPLSARMQHRHLQAALHARRGDPVAARRVLRGAADELARSQVLSASLDLRTAIAVHGTRLAQLDQDLALGRGAAEVFDCTERWRAVTARLPGVRPPASPELAALLARLRALQEDLRQAPDADAVQVEAAAVRRRIQAHARTRGSRPGAVDDVVAPIRRAAAVAALQAEGADLVSLFGHRGQVLAVAVVNGRMRLHRLADEALVAEAARRVRADTRIAATHDLGVMHDAVWASLEDGLQDLDRVLLAPLGLDADRVVVVPDRRTAALPWPLLPTLRGRGVVVTPSATVWASGLGAHHGPVAVRALAGPHLQQADAEVREVAACWPAAVVSGVAEATSTVLQQALTSADLVHVAAHGDHHHENPLFASVQMADGPLHVHDVELGGVSAAHVVLSACDVGRSTVRPGEEPLGLAAGLLAIGARSVVAAVCRIPDAVAAQVMVAYHGHLAAGMPGDLALARAVDGGPAVAGAFVVNGSPWQVALPGTSGAAGLGEGQRADAQVQGEAPHLGQPSA